MIPYGRQEITESDIESVISVLKSDFLTQGPMVPAFEKSVCDATGAGYAVAVNSATSALHIACLALNLGRGDLLWTSPNTFVASANCGLYCGAEVDFVDIDPLTYNISADLLEEKLKTAAKTGKLPKVLIPVHFAGQSCDMEKIHSLGQQYGFRIIEDASHAIGGSYKGQPVGSCKYSDITIFSFHPVKIITTAEGGLAATNDLALAEKMRLLRSHGITREPGLMTQESEGGWYYQQIDLGFNYRITELQAALGVSQMKRLNDFVNRRHEILKRYEILLKDLPLELPFQASYSHSALHLYPVLLKTELLSKSRKEIFQELRDSGLGVNVHYIPVHTQPYYRALGFKEGDFPNSEEYYKKEISIPMYHGLTAEDQNTVADVLRRVIK